MKMSKKEHERFKKFRIRGNRGLEEEEPIISSLPTKGFVYAIQLIRVLIERLDFDKPFRIVIDYDPEQPGTVFRYHIPGRIPKAAEKKRFQQEQEANQD